MTIITSSNDYKLRPLVESDQSFILECLQDFPVGSNTTYQRQNEFANMLYVTGGYAKATVKAGNKCSLTVVLEKTDGTKLGFQHYDFANKVVTLKMGVVHPSHRGNKYSTAYLMLGGALCYTELTCTGAVLELVDTYNSLADLWRPTISADETQRTTDNRFGDGQTYTLNKITVTAAEHETYRAAHSTWGSITYTVS